MKLVSILLISLVVSSFLNGYLYAENYKLKLVSYQVLMTSKLTNNLAKEILDLEKTRQTLVCNRNIEA